MEISIAPFSLMVAETMDKKWLFWSFVSGAVLAPVLMGASLFILMKPLADVLVATPNTAPVTMLGMAFMEYSTPSGQVKQISGAWLWGLVGLFGGILCCVTTALFCVSKNYMRRR